MEMKGKDFGFAINNVIFSDRLLRLEITHDSEVSCSSIVDCVRDHKRRRQDVKNHSNVATCHVEFDLNKNLCETNYEKHEETMLMAKHESRSVWNCINWLTNPSVMRVKELHINSAILAATSPFFYKLFSNGMLESEQKKLTLKIDASEEEAVMELFSFIYINSLSVTSVPALLDVLMAADKFEVESCMKYCIRVLFNMPMTLDSSSLFLDLPSTLLMADSVKPLIVASTQFVTSYYNDLAKFPLEKLLALPLVGIEAMLASDDLQIACEDIIYEVVLKWTKTHYSVLEERQEILGSHLARYIRFPHMTCRRLKKILISDDFRPSVASKLVLEALFFKADRRSTLSSNEPASINHRFVERAYKHRPIKIVEFEVPLSKCIVYLDLKRKECEDLYPSRQMYSQAFHLGGQGFFLSAHCNMDQLTRSNPTEEFVSKYKGNYKLTRGKAAGDRSLFAIPWDSFIAKDCPYFINDVLHLRAELSIHH
ncbi:BTB/POZ domain-containing protein [Cardamine amara subsp. amara]|uniref:BTB/POZ domain-containing protein n=1 Tax=Cardamine amara subsp. amara TaxID=228776 RepID=A0ABD0ZU26_CARAN